MGQLINNSNYKGGETEVREYSESSSNTAGEISIPVENRLIGRVRVSRGGTDSIRATIQVFNENRSDVAGEIILPIENRFIGLVEVVPPPKFTDVYSTTKDAFTWSSLPSLNWGAEEKISVGTETGIAEGYLGFYITPSRNLTVLSSELVLKGVGEENTVLYLYRTSPEWEEYSINHYVRPPREDLIAEGIFRDGEVRFDITDLMASLYWEGKEEQLSFVVVSDKNCHFFSRESGYPPKILVTYIDHVIKSYGRTQCRGELTIYGTNSSDRYGYIEIEGSYGESNVAGEVSIYNPLMLNGEIFISKLDVQGNIQILGYGGKDKEGIISVLRRGIEEKEGFIHISKDTEFGEIQIPYHSSKEGNIHVLAEKTSHVAANISISRLEQYGEIGIKHYSSVPGEIDIFRSDEFDLPGDIYISKEQAFGEIDILPYTDKHGEINVLKQDDSVKDSIIYISREQEIGEVGIAFTSDKYGTIGIPSRHDTRAEINISKPDADAEIIIYDTSVRYGEIQILETEESNKEGYIHIFNNVLNDITGEVEFLVRDASETSGILDVENSAFTSGEILINAYGLSTVGGEIEIQTMLGYVYIM